MRQVAKNLGTSESCLRCWKGQADVSPGRAEGLTNAEKKKLVELRRKNRVLEAEVEIVKRASADFARENVLPMGFRLVHELAADGVPVAEACRSFGCHAPATTSGAVDPLPPARVIAYSADESNEAMYALGFTNDWDTYFAGRAAPLGTSVPGEVEHALF